MLYSNKDLKKLIIPLVIEQTLAIAVGMADTIMISVVGEAAVSGVSLVDTVNILLINIFSALATGGAVVAGHFLGQKRVCQVFCVSFKKIFWGGEPPHLYHPTLLNDTLLKYFGNISNRVSCQ